MIDDDRNRVDYLNLLNDVLKSLVWVAVRHEWNAVVMPNWDRLDILYLHSHLNCDSDRSWRELRAWKGR